MNRPFPSSPKSLFQKRKVISSYFNMNEDCYFANKEQNSNFLRNCGAASVGECNMKIWFGEWICSDECIRSDEGLTLETSAF